jgi:hypothetical protein
MGIGPHIPAVALGTGGTGYLFRRESASHFFLEKRVISHFKRLILAVDEAEELFSSRIVFEIANHRARNHG